MPVTKDEAEIAFQYNIDVNCAEISKTQRFKISQLITRRDKLFGNQFAYSATLEVPPRMVATIDIYKLQLPEKWQPFVQGKLEEVKHDTRIKN